MLVPAKPIAFPALTDLPCSWDSREMWLSWARPSHSLTFRLISKESRIFFYPRFPWDTSDVFPSRNNAARSPCSSKNPTTPLLVKSLAEDFGPVSSKPQAPWRCSFYFLLSQDITLCNKFLGHGKEIPRGSACHFPGALTSPKSQSEQAVCSKLAVSPPDLGEDFLEVSPQA